MSSTLRKSSILSGIIFLLSVGSLQAADDPTWIVGSDTVWESGSGGGPVNLSAYRFYGSMSILDSLEALQDDGTITYRTLHGWDDYEGLSVSPDTTLTIPNRPAAPVRDSDYIFNFRDEKITIQDKTYKCDTMQFMQVGGTPVWTNIETQQSNGKNNWTFEEAGWNPGWMERRFRVRFGYRAMANYEEDPNNNFASSYRIDVIPARPAEPENFCIRIVSDGGGTDTTFISHSDSASYYELRADTVDVDTWTSLHKDCSGSADVSPCWSTYPASLDTTYHLRYAATDSLPASLSVVISNRLNIVRSIIFPSYAYGTEVDESKRKKIEIFNYSENDTIYANLKLKKGSSSPFVLTTHPHRDSTTVVRPRDESECFVRNDTNTIIPKNGLSSGLYTDSLVVTYADGAVQYIAVVLEVARIPWNMSGISGRIISSTENMLVLYVTNAQALSGAMLSYYLGSTFAGQGSDTVQFYGELTYLFYNLTPATAYPVSVKPLGNSNHLEPEQPTMLVTGYTAYATPVFDQTVAVNYLQEQLEFINSAQGSDYTVTAAAGTDTGTVLPPYSLTSYLDSLSQSTFRVRLVHRAGVNPPIPASAPGISSSITGRAPAPALDSITTVNTSGATIDGKIYLRGDFQYRVHSSIGGSGGGSWTTASDSVTIGSGWYDIRRPANSNTFASHYIPVKVGGQCIVTFNSNGGNPSTSQATVKEDAPMGGLPSSISNPTRLGHEFVAWYTTQELTTEWDLATDTVKQDTTLFAKWEVKKEVLTICAAKAMQNITYGQDDSICFTPYADNSTPLPAGCTLSGSLVLNGAAKSSSGHYKVGRYGFDTIMVVLLYNNNKDTVNQHFTISMKADSVSISKKVLELMNVVVNSKVYNDSASAGNPPFTGTQPSLVPGYVVSGDTVALVNGAPVFGNKNVGNQIPITFDPPFTLTGKDSGNYDLPQPTGIAANITRATLTVTPTSGLYKIYDPQQSDPPLTYKASGWKGDDSISSPLKDSLSRTAGEDVGTFRIGLGNLKDTSGNYTISFVDSVLFHIKKATPDKKHFTYAPPQDTVYSGAAKTAIVSMKSPYTLGSAVNLTVKYYQGDSEKNPISVGTYTVKVFVPEGAGNLTHNEIGIEVGSFSIIKKKISVTGGAVMEKAYDGTDTAAVAASGLTFDGLVGGESLARGVDYRVDSARFDSDTVGNQNVTVYVELLPTDKANNYTLIQNGVYLFSGGAITKKSIAVDGGSVASKVYDGADSATVTGLTFTGLAGGINNLTPGSEYSIAARFTGGKNVGTNKEVQVTVTLTGSAAKRYTVTNNPHTLNATGSITQRKITFTTQGGATVGEKPYDGTTVATVTGLKFNNMVANDTLKLNNDYSVSATFDSARVGENKLVTVSVSLLNSTLANNYELSTNSNTDTLRGAIKKKEINIVSAIVSAKSYDGTNTASVLGVNFSGLAPGETLALSEDYRVDSARFDSDTASSTRKVKVYVTLQSTTKANNYTLMNSPYEQTGQIIGKATLTAGHLMPISPDSVLYDGNSHCIDDPALKSGYTGMGSVTKMYDGETTCPTNAGSYTVTVNVTEGTNFSATTGLTLGKLTIHSRTPDSSNFSFSPKDTTYDGTAQSVVVTSTTGMGDITVRYNGSTTPPTNAGKYAITVDVAKGDGFSKATGILLADTFTISKATPDASHFTYTPPSGADTIYSGLNKQATVNLKSPYTIGSTGSLAVKYYMEGVDTSPRNVGTYVVKVIVAGSSNFEDDTVEVGQFSIGQKEINVTGGVVTTKAYDGTDTAIVTGWSFSGNYETLTHMDYKVVSVTFSDSAVGTNKPVTLTVALLPTSTANNYKLSNNGVYSSLTGTIAARTLTIDAATSVAGKIYDGKDTANLDSINVVFSGLVTGETLARDTDYTVDSARFDSKSAGSQTVRVYVTLKNTPKASSYALYNSPFSKSGVIISQRPITIDSVFVAAKTYNSTKTAIVDSLSFSNLVSGEKLNIGNEYTVGSAAFDSAGAGTRTVTVRGVTLNSNNMTAINYTLTSDTCAQGGKTILKATLTKDHLTPTLPASAPFTSDAQRITPTLKGNYTGMGDSVKVMYNSDTTAPVAAGSYTVKVTVSEGRNFAAIDSLELGTFTIVTRNPGPEDFYFDSDSIFVYNGSSQGVTVKSNQSGMGNITVFYAGIPPTSYSRSNTAPTDVGMYAVTVSVTGGTGFPNTDNIPRDTLIITKATPEKTHFTYAPPQDTVYSGGLKAATVNLSSPYTHGDAGSLTVKYYMGGVDTSPRNVGTYAVKVIVAGSSNFEDDTVEVGQFSIIKKEISVTGGVTMTKSYDGKDTAAVTSLTFNGILASESLARGVDYRVDSARFDSAAVGNQNVTVYVTLLPTTTANNYTLIQGGVYPFSGGAITIKSITVSDGTAREKVYDGTDTTTVTGLTFTGLAGGISNLTLGSDYSIIARFTGGKNVGENKDVQVTITLTGSAAKQYTVTNNPYMLTGAGKITKKNISVTGGSVMEKNYDGTNIATVMDLNFDGLVGTDSLVAGNDYSVSAVFNSADTGSSKTVTVTVSLLTTITAGNYNLTKGSGYSHSGQIEQQEITIASAVVSSKSYDGTDTASVLGVNFSGLASGEMLELSEDYRVDSARFDSDTAGSARKVKVYVTLKNTTKANNYKLTNSPYEQGGQTIWKAALTAGHLMPISPDSVSYNGSAHCIVNPALKSGYTGMGSVAVRYDGETTCPTNAGSYTVTVNVTEGTNFSAAAGLTLGKLTIHSRTPDSSDFSFSPKDTTYDGTAQSVVVTSSQGMGDITVKYNGSPTPPTNAGKYAITVDVAKGDGFPKATGILLDTFTIRKATPDASYFTYTLPSGADTIYSGLNKQATVNLKAPYTIGAGSLTVKYYMEGVDTSPRNVGTYAVKVIVAGSSNFEDDTVEVGQFSIGKKVINVTGGSVTTKAYDGTNTATVTGWSFIGNYETLTLNTDYQVVSITFSDSAVGTGKPVTLTVALLPTSTANNYKLSNSSGEYLFTGDITQRTLTIDAATTVAGKIYDGKDTANVDISVVFSGLQNNESLTLNSDYTVDSARFSSKDVGSRMVNVYVTLKNTPKASSYALYNGPFSKSGVSISQRPITIDSVFVAAKTYDSTRTAIVDSLSFSNLVSGEKLELIVDYKVGSAAFDSAGAGTRTVTVRGVTLTSNSVRASNYQLTSDTCAQGGKSIRKATLTKDHLNPTLPIEVSFTNSAQGIDPPTLKGGYTGMGSSVKVMYNSKEETPTVAGPYTVKVTVSEGRNFEAIDSLELGTFTIGIQNPGPEHFYFSTDSVVVYNGEQQSVGVETNQSGMGDITVFYTGIAPTSYSRSSAPPTNAGMYAVTVNVEDGTGFHYGSNIPRDTFIIEKAAPDTSHFTYTPPWNNDTVYSGTGKTATVALRYPYTLGGSTGSLTLQYYKNGAIVTPSPVDVDTIHAYEVKVIVAGSNNFNDDTVKVGQFGISKREIEVASGAVMQKVYDGKNTATITGWSFSNMVSSNILTLGNDYTASAAFISADTGTSKQVILTVALIPTYKANNYKLKNGGVYLFTGNITPRSLTITASTAVAEKIYDGKDTANVPISVDFSGLQNSETLTHGTDYTVDSARFSSKDVGSRAVKVYVTLKNVKKANNYALTNGQTFEKTGVSINKKTISVDSTTTVAEKIYDGTDTVNLDSINVVFSGLVAGEVLKRGDDYTVDSARFNSADVDTTKTVTVGVTLTATAKAKNYELDSTTYSLRNKRIAKADLTADHLLPETPYVVPYDSTPPAEQQGIDKDSVKLKDGYTGLGTVKAVKYTGRTSYTAGSQNTEEKPVNQGTYEVMLDVEEGPNFKAVSNLLLGVMTISSLEPVSGLFEYSPKYTDYNGKPQGVTVTSSQTGMGPILRTWYTDNNNARSNNKPTNAGTYRIEVDVAEGAGYVAKSGIELGNFTINKIDPDSTHLNYNPKIVTYNGNSQDVTVQTNPAYSGMGDISNVTYNGYSDQPKDVGTYAVKVDVAEGTNFNGKSNVPVGNFTINPRNVSISGATIAQKTYDGTRDVSTDDISLSFIGIQNSEVFELGSQYRIDSARFADKNVGTGKVVKVYVTLQESVKNYTLTNGTFEKWSMSIVKRPITISAGTKVPNKTYDGTDTVDLSTIEVAFGEVVSGDTLKRNVDYTVDSVRFDSKDAGSRTAKVYVTLKNTTKANNYALTNGQTFSKSGLSISKKKIDITGVYVAAKTYDSTRTAVVDSLSFSGLVPGEALKLGNDYSVASATFDDANAGANNRTVTVRGVTLTNSAAAKNYTLNSDTCLQTGQSIAKATLTAGHLKPISPVSVTYADTAQGIDTIRLKAGYAGMGSVTAVKYNNSDAKPTNAGTYTVTVDVAEGSNFAAISGLQLGTFTIDRRTPEAADFSVSPEDTTYNGTRQGVTVSTNRSGMGNITVIYKGISPTNSDYNYSNEPVDAGAYAIIVSVADGSNFSSANNILLDTFTIKKARPAASHFTCTLPADTGYNGGEKQANVRLANAYNLGGTGQVTVLYYLGDTSRVTPKNMGTYTVKAVVPSTAGNFFGDTVEVGKFSIVGKEIEVVSGYVQSKEYDGTNTATVVGWYLFGPMQQLVLGTDYTASAAFADADTGASKEVTLTVMLLPTTEASNYTLKDNGVYPFTGSITQRKLTIDAVATNVAEKAYDGSKNIADTTISLTFTNLVAGDTLKLATDYKIDSAHFNSKDAGSRTVEVYVTLEGTSKKANNYALTNGQPFNKQVNITKKQISITGVSVAAKTYDSTKTAVVESLLFSGLASGEVLKLGVDYSVASAAFDNANAGANRKVTVRGVSLTNSVAAQNYTLDSSAFEFDKFTISKATPDASHLSFKQSESITYDGRGHGIDQPTLKEGYTGMGDITVKYNGSTDLPDSVGSYKITVDVAAGANFHSVSGLELGTFTIVPGKPLIDTSIAIAYGSTEYIYISIPEESGRTWTTSDSTVAMATADGRDLIIINGVGEANLKSFVEDEDGRWLEVNLHLKVTPGLLTVEGTWVDTLKSCDGNLNAEVIPGQLVGVLPADDGKVFVTATARYTSPAVPDSGRPISVYYVLEGERAYCYRLPSTNAVFSGTMLPSDGCSGDGSHLDLWGMVVRQAEDSDAANHRYAPWPGVSVAYTINDLQKGELQTDAYGRYFLSGLRLGDIVQLTAIPKYGYTILQQPKTVTIDQSLTKADTIAYALDTISMASLTLSIGDGNVLKRWEREDIADTIFYQVPCAIGQVEVSCAFPPGVGRVISVTSTSIKDGTSTPKGSGDDALLVEVGSLSRTTVDVTVVNPDASRGDKPYTVVLSKELGLFDIITEHLNGTLRVVQNNPDINPTGLTFKECKWYRKRYPDTLFMLVEESRLYYTAGPSLSDKFTERDSMRLWLTLSDGTTLETCPDANNNIPEASDGSGNGSGGSAGNKSMKVAVYPNPVSAGGIVKLKQSDFAGGQDEEEERYVKYSLYSSQGSLVLRGDASVLYGGEGLTMPQTPGIYHLLLEGKNGQRQVVKIAVGDKSRT